MRTDLVRGFRQPALEGERGDAVRLVLCGQRALHDLGDLQAAREWFRLACGAADRVGDAESLAEAALGLGGIWVHEHRTEAERAQALSWQRRALSLTMDDERAIRLRARMAAEADYRNAGSGTVLEVVREARSSGRAVALAEALSLAHHCVLGPEHSALRADLAQELLEVSACTGRRIDRLMGLLWRSVNQFMDADPHAERALRELAGDLAVRDHLAVAYVARAPEVMLAVRAGRFEQAEQLAAACAQAGARCGDLDREAWYRAQIQAIRWFQGRIGESLPDASGHVQSPTLSVIDQSGHGALAVMAAAEGDHRAAAGALGRLGRGDLARVPSSSMWLVTIRSAVEAAALMGDVDTAAAGYRLLEPYAGRPVLVSLAVACYGAVEHCLGVASLTVGQTDRAVAHLRSAIGQNLALGHWPAACLSRHRLGEALAARGAPDDAEAARRELVRARHEADQLGMRLPGRSRTAEAVHLRPAPAPRRCPEPASPGRPGTAERIPEIEPGVVRVRMLGPMEVGGADVGTPVVGARRAAVLAVLALHPGEIVSVERLLDLVWGQRPPRTAVNTLQSHISALRRAIGVREAVLSRPPGYLLRLAGEDCDAAAAEDLIRTGIAAADPDQRITRLQAGLGLWRGQALRDVADSPWLRAQADRLDQLRLDGRLALAETWVRTGRHQLAVPELERLAHDHPLDEQVCLLLMETKYHLGRQAQALDAYLALRRALGALGIEPTAQLRHLHTAILRHDLGPDGHVPGRSSAKQQVVTLRR